MNLVLFSAALLGIASIVVLGENSIVSKFGIFMIWSILLFFSALVFYYDDVEGFWTCALAANLVIMFVGLDVISLVVYEDPSNHFGINLNRVHYMWFAAYAFLVSGINFKSLFQLKNTKEYLKHTPYKCLFILLTFALLCEIEPYIPSISRNIRELYILLIVLVISRKFLTRAR
jgi:hypothetical protein